MRRIIPILGDFMKYLLASDFDGTLLRQKQVSEEDRLAIQEWQKKGHLFCLCSGRSPHAAMAEMKKWNLSPDLLITGNGSTALTPDGTFVFRHPFPAEHLPRLLQRAHELECTIFHLHDQKGRLLIRDLQNTERTNITREEAEQVTDFSQFGAAFKGRVEVAARFANWVNKNFPNITAHVNGAYIDCTVRGVDKETGVAKAAEQFGILPENCYTVGDNGNDLPMLLAYRGAVIETGNPETIQKVGKSVPSVGRYIKEILK